MAEMTAEQVARRWIELYNDGTPESYGSDRFLELYAEDVDWREMPTPLSPGGRSGNLTTVRRGLEEGQAAFRHRKVHLHEVVTEGDRAAMRYAWEATVVVDGLPAPRGSVVQLEVAQFITVANGKIVRSHEYVTVLPPA